MTTRAKVRTSFTPATGRSIVYQLEVLFDLEAEDVDYKKTLDDAIETLDSIGYCVITHKQLIAEDYDAAVKILQTHEVTKVI